MSDSSPEEEKLLAELAEAIARAPEPVREIEIGIPLSIALGRRRPSVACGGCSTPLDFEGIPTRTNVQIQDSFRLIFGPRT